MIGESAATTSGWYSPVSRAIGATWSSVTGDLLIAIAPIMPRPITSRLGLREPLVTNCARPMVPPAPGTFWTCTPDASLSASQHLLRGPGQLIVAAAGTGRGDDLETLDLSPGRAGGRRGHRGRKRRREQQASREA